MNKQVYTHVNDLKGFSAKNCPSLPAPGNLLMCPPDFFDVVDVKNPFMVGKQGTVDKALARRQWDSVKDAFVAAGKSVKTISPVEGLEDMVFCANQALVGLTTRMERVCVPAHMRHSSRRREVPYYEKWFESEGYRVARLSDPSATFEGAGDCRWHPGKRLLWGGYGFRTDPEVYSEIAEIFETPILRLKLANERFYHLDTCFCPLNQEAVLIYPPAFDASSLELILKMFPVVLAAEEGEAVRGLACNAAVVDSKLAIMQKGSSVSVRHMKAVGLDVAEVDTSEFIKSGGSVFCMSSAVY
ncbi:MAG: hypothetical protein HY078_10925 [Elusimicrobia bacterium]|nr:hypothetical protein [Elusimicrobiota bacterium]